MMDEAQAGDNIGTLLRGIAKTDIERGQVISKPGSIHPLTKFRKITKKRGQGPARRPILVLVSAKPQRRVYREWTGASVPFSVPG